MSTEAPRNDEGMTEDDLWGKLAGTHGSERSAILDELVRMVGDRGDFDQAVTLAEASVEAAEESASHQSLAVARTTLGAALFGKGQFSDSGEQHLLAAQLFEQYDSLESAFDAYHKAAWSFGEAGESERALEYADIAISLAAKLESEFALGRGYLSRADLLGTLDHPAAEVLETLDRARTAFREEGAAYEVARVDDRIASVYIDIGRIGDAIEILRNCLALAETEDTDRIAYCAFRLGQALRYNGQPDAAMEMLQRSLDHNRAARDYRAVASVLYEMAHTMVRVDRQEGLDLLAKARAHFESAGSDSMVLTCDEMRAIWLFNGRFHEEALEANQALFDVDVREAQFGARTRAADCLVELERYAEVRDLVDNLGDLFEEFHGRPMWFNLIAAYGTAMHALEDFDSAWTMAKIALSLDESEDADDHARAVLLELRGDEYFSQGNRKAAMADWTHAVARYLKCGDHWSAVRLSEVLLPGGTKPALL